MKIAEGVTVIKVLVAADIVEILGSRGAMSSTGLC